MATDRPYHYLKRPRRSTWPARVCCCAIDTEAAGPCPFGPGELVKLARWHIVTLDKIEKGYAPTNHQSGSHGGTFWAAMSAACRAGGQSVCLSWRAMFLLTATGFWDEVLEGKWLVQTTHESYGEGRLHCTSANGKRKEQAETPSTGPRGKRPRPRFTGLCVTEDPPTIILTRKPCSKGMLKILDVANFSPRRAPVDSSGAVSAESVAGWFQDYYDAVNRFRLGGMENTAACQSHNGFRRNYMTHPVLVHNSGEALSLERDCLYTGRNECFRVGMVYGPVFHLDFNSHYPAAAANLRCPARLRGTGKVNLEAIRQLWWMGYVVCATVRIKSPHPRYPKHKGERTIFPTGDYITSLAHPELVMAEKDGAITDVLVASWYESELLFAEFIREGFELAAAADAAGKPAVRALIKSLLVSNFGKWAQWHWKWNAAPDMFPPAPFCQWWAETPETKEFMEWRAIAGKAEFAGVKQESENSCPAITAWICSAGRVCLADAIETANRTNCIYCDADSLWVTSAGYSCLQRAGMLNDAAPGKMKLVAVYPWMRVHGLKHYELPTAQVHAGVPEDAIRTGDWSFQWKSAERMASAIRRGDKPLALVTNHHRVQAAAYQHGAVGADGRVHPLEVYES